MSVVQVIVVCSSLKARTLSKPEPVQTGINVCPQGIPVLTGFTVYKSKNFSVYVNKRRVLNTKYMEFVILVNNKKRAITMEATCERFVLSYVVEVYYIVIGEQKMKLNNHTIKRAYTFNRYV